MVAQSAQKKLALLTSVEAKGVRVFLRRRLSTIDLQHEVLRLGSVATPSVGAPGLRFEVDL